MPPTTEKLYRLADARQFLPEVSDGRTICLSTFRRWVSHGANGVKLEAVRMGGRLMTSKEAIERFLAAQSPTAGGAK